jgi:hypothetical protein
MNNFLLCTSLRCAVSDDTKSDAGCLSDEEIEDFVLNLDGSITYIVEEDNYSDIGEAEGEDEGETMRGGAAWLLNAQSLSLGVGVSEGDGAQDDVANSPRAVGRPSHGFSASLGYHVSCSVNTHTDAADELVLQGDILHLRSRVWRGRRRQRGEGPAGADGCDA